MNALGQFKIFFTHPIFLACIFAWISAQFIKSIVNLCYGKIHSVGQLLENLFWSTGGMPSSHSAMVTALCTTIGFRSGVGSDVFMFSMIFLFVTVRDAFGVRRSTGLQCSRLNQMGKELKDKKVIDDYEALKEINGHTPLQVILGIILGFVIGLAFSILYKA